MKKTILLPVIALFMIAGCAGVPQKVQQDGSFEIALAGDIMPGRRMKALIEEKGIEYIFRDAVPALQGCGIVFGNLETPLVRDNNGEELKKNGKKQIHLISEEKVADGLKYAGFNVVSLANNHSLDYGQNGIIQTMEILDSRGIKYQGVRKGDLSRPNEPVIMEVNGTKVGFLCYSEVSHWKFQPTVTKWGTIPCYHKEIKRDVENARGKVDVLIVYLHWGKEGKKVQKFQYVNAKKILDFGADAIVASHTHLFQDIEMYKGRYILYGLGNFVFDMEEEWTKSGAIVKMKIEGKKIAGISVVPMQIKDYKTELVTDEKKKWEFLNALKLKNLGLNQLY